MADTVRLRNISDQDRHVPLLGDRLVKADCVVEIPTGWLEHQPSCSSQVTRYDPASGEWMQERCPGCLTWPAETWAVENAKGGKK